MDSSLIFLYSLFFNSEFQLFLNLFLYGLCFSFSPINMRISKP